MSENEDEKNMNAEGAQEGGSNGDSFAPGDFERILDVKVRLSVELGRKKMPIGEVLALNSGSVVEFNKGADEPLDILVNDQLIAKGEPVVLGDRYGVRITEVVSTNARVKSGSPAIDEEAA